MTAVDDMVGEMLGFVICSVYFVGMLQDAVVEVSNDAVTMVGIVVQDATFGVSNDDECLCCSLESCCGIGYCCG